MRSRRVVPLIAALSLALGFGACSTTSPSEPARWGSEQALLKVEGGSATLQIFDGGCYGSFGSITQPIPAGSFDLPGTFTQLMGVFPGSVQYEAQFIGTAAGKRIVLTVTVPGQQRTLGPFNLTYGVGEELQNCLYP